MKLNLSLQVGAALIAFVCFLLAALASVFGWNLGRFNAIAWGLLFFLLAVVPI